MITLQLQPGSAFKRNNPFPIKASIIGTEIRRDCAEGAPAGVSPACNSDGVNDLEPAPVAYIGSKRLHILFRFQLGARNVRTRCLEVSEFSAIRITYPQDPSLRDRD